MDEDRWNVEYRCDVCDRTFSNSRTLRRHQRTHTHDRLFQCFACDRTFVNNDNLTQHRRVHFVETCGVSRLALRDDYLNFRRGLHRDQVNPPLPPCPPPTLPPPPPLPLYPIQIGGAGPNDNNEDDENAENDELYRRNRHAINTYYR